MSTMAKRQRRSFTPQFKAEAVKLVAESGKTITAVARDLDLTVSALSSPEGLRARHLGAATVPNGPLMNRTASRAWGTDWPHGSRSD